MKKIIKKIVRKSDLWNSVAQLFYFRKDKKYLRAICSFRENPGIVQIEGKASSFGIPAIHKIVTGGENGLFACIRWVLDDLLFCEKMGFVPYVFFENSIYYDKAITETENAFEYYYDQPYPNVLDLLDCSPIVSLAYGRKMVAEEVNGRVSYIVSDDYISQMASIVSRYLHFNETTDEIIRNHIEKMELDQKTLGVHIRGTDYKIGYNNHPVFVEPKDYYPVIDECLAEGYFKKIFLATDDQLVLEDFCKKYDKLDVIYAKDIARTSNLIGVHKSTELKSPYLLGLDAIKDMLSLSVCGGIISGYSNVSMIARVYKQSRGDLFLFDKIVSKGINKNSNNAV